MLTPRGSVVAVSALVLAVAGRVFGAPEFYLFAVVLVALVVGSLIHVATVEPNLEVTRSVHPRRVHAGVPARVDITVVNRARRRSPIVEITDPVTATRGARILVDPLATGESRRCAYRLPTSRRGMLMIGPASSTVMDPFGLVRKRRFILDTTDLTIYPRLDRVIAPRGTSGRDPLAGIGRPDTTQGPGEDFYALREYVMGDDLRHIDWRSTARNDDLMVRQDEFPWQGRSTVFVDTRSSHMGPEELEHALSAAAGIADAGIRRGDLVRLVLADGSDSGITSGSTGLSILLEMLAVASASTDMDTPTIIRSLTTAHATGSLVVITSGISDTETTELAKLRSAFRPVTIVNLADDAAAGSSGSEEIPAYEGFEVLHLRQGDFATNWNRSMGRRRDPRTA